MSDLPAWAQTYAAVGGASLLSGLLAWFTGHRISDANVRKVNAEAQKIEAEARTETRTEASRVEAARVDFEKALNERVTMVMESLQGQVKYLTGLVETQSSKINEQSVLIAKMEVEMKELHMALDLKTQRLHQVLKLLPSLGDIYPQEFDIRSLGNPA